MPSADEPSNHVRQPVQSVDRAALILEFLAIRGWSGVTEIGSQLGVHKSTASRLLATLEAHDLVVQHEESGKYALGFGLVHLARAVTSGFDLKRRARPACEQLAEDTGETVVLAILDDDEVMNIDQVISRASSVVSMSWLGRRTPMHCSANGKALLANLPQRRRAALLDGPLEALTPRTITDSEELERQLDLVRKDGYAITVEELELGLSAVAAPIFAVDGELLGAVSVSGPTYRIPSKRLAELGDIVRATAASIGGHRDLDVPPDVRG